MKIANVTYDGKNFVALGNGENALLLDTVGEQHNRNRDEFTADWMIQHPELMNDVEDEMRSRGIRVKLDDLSFGPCVLNPGKIVCIGKNYAEHAKETKSAIPDNPVLFSKFSDSVFGHKGKVAVPEGVSKLDYEAELGLVIGKTAFKVTVEHALEHVFGYFPANDLSARDLQFLTGQWLIGKTLPGFAPIGPFITTSDEIPDPNSLEISLKLNGETRQKSNTSHMIFHCKYLISYISQYFPLNPGDIILTGTPEGVILGMPPEKQVWIKPGDQSLVEIEKLGSLITYF